MIPMDHNIIYSHVSWDQLQINMDDVFLSMGTGYIPDKDILEQLDRLKKEIAHRCNPSYLYASFEAKQSCKNHIGVGTVKFHTGTIITPYLLNADYYILFVATAGNDFEMFQSEIKSSGDIYKEFLVDALGSAIAEAVVKELCKDVELRTNGMGVSYPYSPGYCGWHVSQQQKIFTLLPDYPCGITLNASSLMTPIKSVSGVIAVGKNVIKQKYGCELCKKKDCYKNKNRIR